MLIHCFDVMYTLLLLYYDQALNAHPHHMETLSTDIHQFISIISVIIFVSVLVHTQTKTLLHGVRLTTRWEDTTSQNTDWSKSHLEKKNLLE